MRRENRKVLQRGRFSDGLSEVRCGPSDEKSKSNPIRGVQRLSIFGAVEEVAAAGVVVGGLHQISNAQRRAYPKKRKAKRAKKRSRSRRR